MNTRELALIDFIKARIASMLSTPEAWGTSLSIEEGVLQLVEIRRVLIDPTCKDTVTHEVMRSFARFVRSHLENATPEPLALQLEARRQNEQFIPLLSSFVEDDELRVPPSGPEAAVSADEAEDELEEWAALRLLTPDRLREGVERAALFYRQSVAATARRRNVLVPVLFPNATGLPQ